MPANRKIFDNDLLDLKNHLLAMGKQVEEAIEKSVEALIEHNVDLAKEVINQDSRINNMETITDEKVIQLITQQQPVAKDLRKIVTALKMNTSLERMGDLARNIAKITIRLDKKPTEQTGARIVEIATIVIAMVHDIMVAYLEEDELAAETVASMDDKVDSLYKNYLNTLFSDVHQNYKLAEEATQYAFIGRHLERIGDHVTNIAELLVYLEKAKKLDLNK